MFVLEKGENMVLAKAGQPISKIQVGVGWRENDGASDHDFDIDVFAYLVDAETLKGVQDLGVFCFMNVDGKGTTSAKKYGGFFSSVDSVVSDILKSSPVAITKDNLTGKGDGDDETLYVNGENLPKDKAIIVGVNIFKAQERIQNFGMVSDLYCRFPGGEQGEIRYNLTENFSKFNAALMCQIYWFEDDLKVKALGRGANGDILQVAQAFR